jgi:hypothetical protein
MLFRHPQYRSNATVADFFDAYGDATVPQTRQSE